MSSTARAADAADSSSDGIHAITRVSVVGSSPKAFIERAVTMPGSREPMRIGVNDGWAGKYGVAGTRFEPHPTANDVFAAALAACLTGTYVAALSARTFELTGENVSAEASYDYGPTAQGDWILRNLTLRITLRIPEEFHSTAERVAAVYERQCPLSSSLAGGRTRISTEISFA